MTVFRFRTSDTNPAHTRIRLFAGPDAEHLALAGELTFRNDEFRAFADAITDYNERNDPEQRGAPCEGCGAVGYVDGDAGLCLLCLNGPVPARREP